LWEVNGEDRPQRRVAARSGKGPWLTAVLEAKGGRLATGATMEPSAAEMGSRGGENWSRGGREGQPNLAPLITSSPTQLGSLVVGEGWWASWLWPRSASRFFRNRKPLWERDRAGQNGSKQAENECAWKNFGV